jgi:hypothetical protein
MQRELTSRGEVGLGEGNTLTNKKKHRGMREAEPNVILAQIIPQELAAYVLTRPLLKVQAASTVDRSAKY